MSDPATPPGTPHGPDPVRCPAHAVPLFGGRFDHDPDAYEDLRPASVVPVKLDLDLWGWLVIGGAEVRAVLANAEGVWTNDSRLWHGWQSVGVAPPPVVRQMGYKSVFANGVDHRRLMQPIDRAMGELDPSGTAAYIAEIADAQVEVFAGEGRAEVMSQYAHVLPALIMTGLLGMDERYAAGLSVAFRLLEEPEKADSGSRRLDALLEQLVAEKRESPGPDLVSWMMEYGDLTLREVRDQARLLLTVGLAACAALIGAAIHALLTDAGLRRSVLQGYRSMTELTNRIVRQAPPVVNVFGRFATQDTCLGGVNIGKGDLVILSLAAANADPAPPRSGRSRPDVQDHVGWGVGEHACPQKARDLTLKIVEICAARFLTHLPDARMNMPEDPAWTTFQGVRSLEELNVSFSRVREMLVPGKPRYLPVPTFIKAAPSHAAGKKSTKSVVRNLFRS